MNSIEIYISNYKDAMSTAQRTIYAGLIISIFSHFYALGYMPSEKYTIPLLGIEMTKNAISIYGLSILYLYTAVHCLFFTCLAERNFNKITCLEIRDAMILYPSILMGNVYYQCFLGSILLSIWYGIFKSAGLVPSLWLSVAIGTVISSPYFISLKIGSNLRSLS